MSDQKEKEQSKPASRWDLSNTRLLTWLPMRRMSRSSDEHQAPGEFDTEAPPPPPSNSNERTSTRRSVNYHPEQISHSSCVTAARGFLQKCNEKLKRFGRKFTIPDKQEMRKLGITCDFGFLVFILTKYVKDPESMTWFSVAFALLVCVGLFTFFIGYTRLGSACIFSAIYGSFAYLLWLHYAILALVPTTLWMITIPIIIYGEYAPSPEIEGWDKVKRCTQKRMPDQLKNRV